MSVSRVLLAAITLAMMCLLALPARTRGVVNGVPIPCDDRRYDAVGLFMIGGGPPGECGGSISGTCTLIDDRTVVFARHSLGIAPLDPLPRPGELYARVRFRRARDGSAVNSLWYNGTWCHGVYQEFLISRMYDAPGQTDLVIGQLAGRPQGIAPISAELANPPVRDTEIILAGWGYRGECLATGPAWELSSARGQLPDQGAATDFIVYSPCAMLTVEPCRMCGPGGPWVSGNLHDSGAPLLIERPNGDGALELRLIGVVSSTTTARRPSAWNNAGAAPMIVEAPSLRQADFNTDGRVDIRDVYDFVEVYFEAGCLADYDRNGAVDLSDVSVFLTDYFASR